MSLVPDCDGIVSLIDQQPRAMMTHHSKPVIVLLQFMKKADVTHGDNHKMLRKEKNMK